MLDHSAIVRVSAFVFVCFGDVHLNYIWSLLRMILNLSFRYSQGDGMQQLVCRGNTERKSTSTSIHKSCYAFVPDRFSVGIFKIVSFLLANYLFHFTCISLSSESGDNQ